MVKKLKKVDVVIVGSGWAGGIPAAELTKKDYKVVVLERGKDQNREDFIGSKDELRYSRRYGLMQDLTKETITTRNYLDETAKPLRNNEKFVFGTGTGGTSIHWNGTCFRFWPYDFEIYSKTVERYGEDKIPEEMTIQDWGITYDEMEPYYDTFEKMAGISGEPSPLGPKRSDDYPNPPLKKNMQIRLFEKATEALGYQPYAVPGGNVSQKYENPDGETLNACVYCSFCETYGCDFGAKSDPIATVLKTAEKTGNYELRNDSYVTRVIYDGKKATGLRYIDTETGEEYEQPADLVVLAGFTFTNNRLLLLSGIGKPYDPETGQGVVGRNMTAHDNQVSYVGATGFFNDKKFNSYAGTGVLGSVIDDFSSDRIDHSDLDFIHGFEIQLELTGDRPIETNRVPKGTPSWGEEFKEKSVFYTNRSFEVFIQVAGLPIKHNYYDLDPNYKDTFGDPLLRVTRKHTDQERKLAQYGIEKCKEIMEEMGADIVDTDEVPDDLEFNSSYTEGHVCGGVIMGDNPETSAVNNYLQMWDMENLFVVGSSAFPHIGNYNPTETIGALAYRAAEGMDKYLKGDGGLIVEAKKDEKAI